MLLNVFVCDNVVKLQVCLNSAQFEYHLSGHELYLYPVLV